jgi:membrane protease YdiL (CAAX protease family)
MSGPVLLLNRLGGRWVAVVGSAMLWGVLHSLLAPTWGVAIWWPFLIFSTAFLTWREKGYWIGIATAATIHLLNNVGPALLIARG